MENWGIYFMQPLVREFAEFLHLGNSTIILYRFGSVVAAAEQLLDIENYSVSTS